MPLTTVRQEVSIRLSEVQSFLSVIKEGEKPRATQSKNTNTNKGLFLVLLYSTLEYAVTRSIIEYAETVNLTKVNYQHISSSLYALTLDSQLTSCAMVGREQRWQKRIELFEKQSSTDTVRISDSAFLEQLENIWTRTIFKVFNILGITNPALYDPRVSQYINEVVEKRNAVVHGRESAAVIGQSYTTGRLQTLYEELSKQMQYMMVCFEQHLDAKNFINAQHKHIY